MPKYLVTQEWISHDQAVIEASDYKEAKHRALNDDSIEWESCYDETLNDVEIEEVDECDA